MEVREAKELLERLVDSRGKAEHRLARECLKAYETRLFGALGGLMGDRDRLIRESESLLDSLTKKRPHDANEAMLRLRRATSEIKAAKDVTT